MRRRSSMITFDPLSKHLRGGIFLTTAQSLNQLQYQTRHDDYFRRTVQSQWRMYFSLTSCSTADGCTHVLRLRCDSARDSHMPYCCYLFVGFCFCCEFLFVFLNQNYTTSLHIQKVGWLPGGGKSEVWSNWSATDVAEQTKMLNPCIVRPAIIFLNYSNASMD